MHLRVVGVGNVVEAESVGEESGVDDDEVETNGTDGQVDTVSDGVGEDLLEIPLVGSVGRENSVDGQGHDCSIVEKGDNEDHERREVEFECESHDGETEDDTNCDCTTKISNDSLNR